MDRLLFVGSLTNGSISTLRLRPDGTLLHTHTPPAAPASFKRSWQAMHPSLPSLYSADGAAGVVSAWRVAADGALAPWGAGVRVGDNPVLVAVADPRTLVAAVYGAGAVATMQLDAVGRPVPPARFSNHSGASECASPVRAARQLAPHPHGAFVRGRAVLVPDLGTDRVYHYVLGRDGRLGLRSSVPTVVCLGPRHLHWSPSGRWVLLVHEMGNLVSVWRWVEGAGLAPAPVQPPTSTVPAGVAYCTDPADPGWRTRRCSKAAEVRALPLGAGEAAVYVANRGHNSLRRLLLDERTGALRDPEGGPDYTAAQWPRAFSTDAERRLLVVAERDGGAGGEGAVSAFKVGEAGRLGRVSAVGAVAPGAVLLGR